MIWLDRARKRLSSLRNESKREIKIESERKIVIVIAMEMLSGYSYDINCCRNILR